MLPRASLRAARAATLLRPSFPLRRSIAHRAAAPSFQRAPSRPVARAKGIIDTRGIASGKSSADEIIEDITEQYSTTKDEFEIAVEETEKNTLYAAEDRAAAAEEMAKLKDMYDTALAEQPESVAADVKRRIGSRIRELDEAIKGLEESAQHES